MTALLIDLDGVVYESDAPIDGALDALAWLREEDVPHLFLTNTTSRPRSALVEKLAGYGFDVDAAQILTPPVAADRWLSHNCPGPAALFVAPDTLEDFTSIPHADEGSDDVASVVVGDYGERWTFDELNRAFRLLMQDEKPELVALGMTRYWKADDGLRLDTAPFVVALSHASGVEPTVLGKPARLFFAAALSALGSDAADTIMIGDDVKSDIGGAQQWDIRGVQVKTGKFRTGDLDGDVDPDLVIDSIADLPDRWRELEAL